MQGTVATSPRAAVRSPSARDVVALVKPRITLMVLLTAAGGVWLSPAASVGAKPGASTHASWTIGLALLGTALIVGGANALNMFIERDIDGFMKRTKDRPLPAGRMSPRFALLFGVVLSVIAVPVLAVLANILYVLAYTPLKQRSHWALQVGAIPGAIPPLLGWTAATGRVDEGGLVLFGILFFWQIAHFHAIALFRKLEYGRAGLVVLPNVEGDESARHSIVRHASALVFVSLLLYPLHVAHGVYLASALVLGAGFVGVSLLGLRKNASTRWARGVFIASLLYLTGLFAAIAVDALVS